MGAPTDKPTWLGKLLMDSFLERTHAMGPERQAKILEVARALHRHRKLRAAAVGDKQGSGS